MNLRNKTILKYGHLLTRKLKSPKENYQVKLSEVLKGLYEKEHDFFFEILSTLLKEGEMKRSSEEKRRSFVLEFFETLGIEVSTKRVETSKKIGRYEIVEQSEFSFTYHRSSNCSYTATFFLIFPEAS